MRRIRHRQRPPARALALPMTVRQAPLTLIAVTATALLLASTASLVLPAVLVQ